MESFSSVDFVSEFDFPIPGTFSKPVRQIKFYRHDNKDEVEYALDIAKENLCPCKIRYIVLTTEANELLKDVGNVELFCDDQTEEISITVNETELVGTEDLKTKLLKKLSDLSATLQESMIPIDTQKTEFLLKHFDKFLSSKSDVAAFIETGNIKFIFRSDDDKNVIAEECENVNDEIICENIKALDRKDIIKLELDRANIQKEASKMEIGEDCVKVEGFPVDVPPTKLKIYKAMQVNHTLTETVADDIATLLTKEGVTAFCNEMVRLQIPNKDLFLWKVEGDTLYAVGRNEKVAKIGLEAIKNCLVIIEEDFSALTFPDESHMIQFEDCLQRDFQDEIVLNFSDLSKVFVATILNREEQARSRVERFKSDYTLETKDVACTPEKIFYLEASQEYLRAEMSSRNSLAVEKGSMKESLKITAYQSDVLALEQKKVCRRSLGVNNDDVKKKYERIAQEASERFRCKCKLSDTKTIVCVKEGRIEEQKVDVIVNSVSGDLEIAVTNEESVTYSIAKAAGPTASESLRQKYPKGAKLGEVAVGDKGNLKCKKLYHVVLDKFPKNPKDEKNLVSRSEANLRKVIDTCLKTAEMSGYTSIAFPAVGAGVHCYPLEMVTKNILGRIVDHIYNNFETCLGNIIITIRSQDTKVKKAFTDEIQKRISLDAKEGKTCLIERPQWLCKWKVDVVGETEEELQDFVKMINTSPM